MIRFAAATGMRPKSGSRLNARTSTGPDGSSGSREPTSKGGLRRMGRPPGRCARCRCPPWRWQRSMTPAPARHAARVPRPAGAHVNLRNFRRREWHPALDAAGVPPRRIYDLRSTFASQALAAGVSVFELARIMGT